MSAYITRRCLAPHRTMHHPLGLPMQTMEMLETVTDGYTYGGVAFQVQPRIRVLDAGGNLLTGDSEFVVEVSFTTNPR